MTSEQRLERRDTRIADLIRFAGTSLPGDLYELRSILQLAYESGYLHGSRDTAQRAVDLLNPEDRP